MLGSRALVIGATGAIGPSLVNFLLAKGCKVRIYSRQTPAPALFSGNVEQLQGDINDDGKLAQALRDIEVVFHLAALLHIENPLPGMAGLYQEVNIAGTQQVVRQSVIAGVRRLVYFSTVKVYGIHQREPVSESVEPNPRTIYAQTKLAGEKIVSSASDLETVVLRLSAVYGAGLGGSWERMVKAISQGWFIPVGTLRNQRSLTHVDDVARAAWFAAVYPAAAGNIYNVVGHEAVTMYEILAAIYAAFGKSVPSLRIPGFAALSGIELLDKSLSLMGKRSPLTAEAVGQLILDEVYSGAKLRLHGLETLTVLNEGWRETIAAFRDKSETVENRVGV